MVHTEQELFDKVVGHLAQQKVKSALFNEPTALDSEGNWSCLYRGPNNTQCAFGVLIPDAAYTPFLEGFTCRTLLNEAERKVAGEALDEYLFTLNEYRLKEAMTTAFVDAMIPLIPHKELLRGLQAVHDSDSGPDSWGWRLETLAKHCGLEFDRAAFEQKMKGE
jgi:hypothetical protein